MPVCDVCNKTMNWEEGYVLTTKQVTTSESYWVSAFKGVWSHAHSMDPGGDSVGMLVKQQAAQSSGWLVCESCSGNFSLTGEKHRLTQKAVMATRRARDLRLPKRLLLLQQMLGRVYMVFGRQASRLPGGCPVEKKKEARQFQSRNKIPHASSATAVYGTDDCFQLSILRRFRDEILLNSFIGKNFVRFYYRIGPHVAAI